MVESWQKRSKLSLKKMTKIVEATKKLDSPNSTAKTFVLGPPHVVTVSNQIIQTLSFMTESTNQINASRNEQNQVTKNGVVVEPKGENNVKIGDNTYELTPEVQTQITPETQTNYEFNKMSDDDLIMFDSTIFLTILIIIQTLIVYQDGMNI